MSIEAVNWALRVPVGGNQKVVLIGLANHAHPDGTEAYPSYDTLAIYACCDRSTAKRNAKKLEADGWIERDGLGPQGQVKWKLNMGGQNAPGQNAPGGISTPEGGAPVPPEPSKEPSSTRNRASEVPDDFPGELRPHANAAYKVLKSVAVERGAKEISPRALATVIMARPRKPIVRAAHDCAAWILDHPNKPCKDVLSRYRNWLDREDDLAAVERLSGAESTLPTNVTRLRDKDAERRARAEQDREAIQRTISKET